MRHQRPDGSRHLVGQRDGDQHARLTRQHAGQPRSGFVGVTGRNLGCRARAQDYKSSQTALAHLGRSPQPLLAATGVLPWDEAEPGCKVSPAAESTGGRRQRNQRRRNHGTNTRYRHKPLRCGSASKALPWQSIASLLELLENLHGRGLDRRRLEPFPDRHFSKDCSRLLP